MISASGGSGSPDAEGLSTSLGSNSTADSSLANSMDTVSLKDAKVNGLTLPVAVLLFTFKGL